MTANTYDSTVIFVFSFCYNDLTWMMKIHNIYILLYALSCTHVLHAMRLPMSPTSVSCLIPLLFGHV